MPVLRRVLVFTAAMLVLGVAAGLAWLWLAEPAQWEVTQNGLILTQAASRGQFSVIVVFLAVGAVVSLAGGVLATVLLGDLGWVVTPLVVSATGAAALIAWRLGVWLGPPDPTTVPGLSRGDSVPSQLAVDTVAPFVVWPICGLIGLILATWARRDGSSSSRDQGVV